MSPLVITWAPAGFAYREPAEAALREVVKRLGLTRRVRSIVVVVRPRIKGDEGIVAWREGRHRTSIRMYLDLGNFLTPDGRKSLARSGHTPCSIPRVRYSGRAFRATAFHELSHVADALTHGIDSNDVPRGRWATFNEVWNVWIDGRLRRRGSPTLTRRERLRAFHHTFGRRGRTRRRSLQVFNRLWSADRLSQRDLLEAVEILVG
jgi:hypothetical protein